VLCRCCYNLTLCLFWTHPIPLFGRCSGQWRSLGKARQRRTPRQIVPTPPISTRSLFTPTSALYKDQFSIETERGTTESRAYC
jgi:hypothetical protein